MEKPKDYYQLLGVPRDASLTAIRRAFRRLARAFRPGAEVERAPAAFDELQAAYETLADKDRRQRYDEQLRGLERAGSAGWSSLRRLASARGLRRPVRPTSLTGEIVLGAREARAGGVLSLDVPVTATCDVCEGTGGHGLDCDRCLGEGKIARRLPVPVSIPPGVRDGAVFQVRTDDPAVPSLVLTVHLRRA